MPEKLFLKRSLVFLLGLAFSLVLLESAIRMTGSVLKSSQERMNTDALARGGAYRIMCIGESTTADLGSTIVSYPRQLGEILNARSPRGFSVINKGITDGDTPAIMAELAENLNVYRPDMVVAMMGINDGREKFDQEGAVKAGRPRLDDIFKTLRLVSLLTGDVEKKRKVDEQLERPAYLGSPGGDKLNEEERKISAGGLDLMRRGRFDEAREVFERGAKEWEHVVWSYLGLGGAYSELHEYAKAERIYRNVIDGSIYGEGTEAALSSKARSTRNIQQLNALLYLGWYYLEQAKYDEAANVFDKAAQIRPDLAFKGLAALYEKKGDIARAELYRCKGMEASLEIVNPVTRMNYNRLKKMLDARKIKLIAVQYPTKDIVSLKKVFDDPRGVIFVDNEKIFRDVLEKELYGEYFYDRCYCDFGHCTNRGNRLLAGNVAEAILENVFAKK